MTSNHVHDDYDDLKQTDERGKMDSLLLDEVPFTLAGLKQLAAALRDGRITIV